MQIMWWHLLQLTMILHESLRLFPPVPLNRRFITRDVKLGDLELPKDLGLWLPVVALHHDPDLWGDNYMKFQPERFSEGTAKVGQHQMALLPFSFGPRTCVGHTFAMQEAKVIMAMLLRQFRFRLSPQYRHTPKIGILTLAPQHGMPLVIEKVGS
jgi:cytochrome P450